MRVTENYKIGNASHWNKAYYFLTTFAAMSFPLIDNSDCIKVNTVATLTPVLIIQGRSINL